MKREEKDGGGGKENEKERRQRNRRGECLMSSFTYTRMHIHACALVIV